MLEVAVGKFLDTSLIRADVQPRVVRLLIKGRLLQLVLPAEVRRPACLQSAPVTAQPLTCSRDSLLDGTLAPGHRVTRHVMHPTACAYWRAQRLTAVLAVLLCR